VSDAVRAILDGHIVLSRKLAQRNHYPAVDVLMSISRLTPAVTEAAHRKAIAELKQVLAYYYDAEDLIQIGAYVKGSDKRTDWAISKFEAVQDFLRQDMDEGFSYEDTKALLHRIFGDGS
jgi:flagellum-specific ATP synthase